MQSTSQIMVPPGVGCGHVPVISQGVRLGGGTSTWVSVSPADRRYVFSRRQARSSRAFADFLLTRRTAFVLQHEQPA
jgi:hypothetical protein